MDSEQTPAKASDWSVAVEFESHWERFGSACACGDLAGRCAICRHGWDAFCAWLDDRA